MLDPDKQVAGALAEAFVAMYELDHQRADEFKSFSDGIHRCQYVLVARLFRRELTQRWSPS